ncbi:hypothetical protein GCM10028801_10250 [Nocardioides maradonensis]
MSIEHLKQAAADRSKAAEDRVRSALTTMGRTAVPISFAAVAREAGVSTDFLYRHPQFRRAITEMRQANKGTRRGPTTDTVLAEDDSSGGTVRALAALLREMKARHRDEVARLNNALAAAHGDNLLLRRRIEGCARCSASRHDSGLDNT